MACSRAWCVRQWVVLRAALYGQVCNGPLTGLVRETWLPLVPFLFPPRVATACSRAWYVRLARHVRSQDLAGVAMACSLTGLIRETQKAGTFQLVLEHLQQPAHGVGASDKASQIHYNVVLVLQRPAQPFSAGRDVWPEGASAGRELSQNVAGALSAPDEVWRCRLNVLASTNLQRSWRAGRMRPE